MIKETLEEAAKSNYENKTARIPVPTSHWINSEFLQIQNFKEGAKWQQEQAKEMHKQEIIDAWEDGQGSFSTRNAEQYYNETFE